MEQLLIEDLILSHQEIVYGVLKRFQFYGSNPLFEDYFQIGLIHLAQAFKKFEGDWSSEEGLFKLAGFTYQNVYWGILDQLRKDQKFHQHSQSVDDEFFKSISEDSYESALLSDLTLENFLSHLDRDEQIYLKQRVMENLTSKTIMEKNRWSKRKVYKMRQEIGLKFRRFQEV